MAARVTLEVRAIGDECWEKHMSEIAVYSDTERAVPRRGHGLREGYLIRISRGFERLVFFVEWVGAMNHVEISEMWMRESVEAWKGCFHKAPLGVQCRGCVHAFRDGYCVRETGREAWLAIETSDAARVPERPRVNGVGRRTMITYIVVCISESPKHASFACAGDIARYTCFRCSHRKHARTLSARLPHVSCASTVVGGGRRITGVGKRPSFFRDVCPDRA